MNTKLIFVNMSNRLYATVNGLWQYDYGRILRIQGLDLPTAVEIHFSLQETGGEAVTRVGVTKDGATDVVIPDSMLEAGDVTEDYYIYAFIYLTSDDAGETTHKIRMRVQSRPRPEAFDTPEDAELFRAAIAAVNEAADRAEEAEENTAASEKKTAEHLGTVEALAQQVTEEKSRVEELENEVAENTETVRKLAQQTGLDAEEVAENKEQVVLLAQQVAANGEQVAADKGEVRLLAEQVSANAKQVEENTAQVAADKEEVAENTVQVAENTRQVASNTEKVAALTAKAEQYTEAAKRSIQADWGENQEDSPSYVKNRTHWVERSTGSVIYSVSGLELSNEEARVSDVIPLIIGETYTVNLNGTDYIATAVDGSVLGDGGYSGIPTLCNEGVNWETGEGLVFVIVASPEYIKEFGFATIIAIADGSTTADITIITQSSETIHKLDNKFLDLDWLPVKVETETEILAETTYSIKNTSAADVEVPLDITAGNTYTISWNGTEYQCEAYEIEAYGYVFVLLGDCSAEIEGATATGEPFGICVFCEEYRQVLNLSYYGNVRPNEKETGKEYEFTISIHCTTSDVDKIPEEYLPDSIDPKLIKDMYYTEEGGVEILSECQPTYDKDEGCFTAFLTAIPTAGSTYTINWNGVEYECVAQDASAIETGAVILGDGTDFGLSGDGEPFTIAVVESDGQNILMAIAVDDSTELTLSIYGDGEIIHKIDNKYLDLEWLPTNDTTVLLPEQSVSITTGYNEGSNEDVSVYVGFIDFTELSTGETIYVEFAGKKYTCVAYQDSNYVYAGNGALLPDKGLTDTGEPFLIAIAFSKIDGFGGAIYHATQGEYTVAIYGKAPNKMPEEFLPESVDSVILRSSTEGSTKLFKLTIDDEGILSADEIVEEE